MLTKMRNMLTEKGQGIVEYALLLAFVVALATMLNGVGLASAVKDTFDKVASLLSGDSNYALMLNKYGNVGRRSLVNLSDEKNSDGKYTIVSDIVPNDERIAADETALENLANFFMDKDMKYLRDEVFNKQWGNNTENTLLTKDIKFFNYDDKNSVEYHYDANAGTYTQGTNYVSMSPTLNSASYDANDVVHWLQGDYSGYKNSNSSYTTNGYDSNNRYFYSNSVIDPNGKGAHIYTKFEWSGTGDSAKVTGVKVEVRQKKTGTTLVSKSVGTLK